MNHPQRLLIIDAETSGLDPRRHAMLTLCAKVWEEGRGVVETLNMYVNMGVFEVDPKAMEVNGLDIADIIRVGLKPAKAVQVLSDFVTRWFFRRAGDDPRFVHPVLVGHHIEFDLGFIRALFAQADADELFQTLFCFRWNDVKYIDTASVLRFMALAKLPGLKDVRLHAPTLAPSARELGVRVNSATYHTADGDTGITADVLDVLLSTMAKLIRTSRYAFH
jgi:DNA polymerase III epsilon subunit-like protein